MRWSDEAVEAAAKAWQKAEGPFEDWMRAALNAALEAEIRAGTGMTIASIPKGYTYQLVKLTEPGSIFIASTDPQSSPPQRRLAEHAGVDQPEKRRL